MHIRDNLLISTIYDDNKTIDISLQDIRLTTCLGDVLVWQKRGRHRVKSNQVGDGMDLVYIQSRPIMSHALDTQWCLYALALYQEYDEYSHQWSTYLYKFGSSDDKIAFVNACLSAHAIPYILEQKKNFVCLQGDYISYLDQEKMFVSLTHAGHAWALSFIYGLVLGYGEIELDEEGLHGMRIYLPLVGTIVNHVDLIKKVVDYIGQLGMYIRIHMQDTTYGQHMSIHIRDWELLSILTRWIDESVAITKMNTAKALKKNLIARLNTTTADLHLIDTVDHSVVKFLRK